MVATKLNKEQQQAVEHQNGPLLIVAGAGTGKTTVITQRIEWLINNNLASPEEILALTFTEKAAGELVERVDKALPYGYCDLWISTFHSFAERILKEHGLDMGLTTDFKLLDTTQSWLLIRKNLAKFPLDYYRPLGNANKFISALLQHFSKCKDELVTPDNYLDLAESYRLDNDLEHDEDASTEYKRLQEIAESYKIYQQLLLDNNYLDFGDLINYVYELFKKRPAILKKYQQQFKYILIDEFQDTNYAQYQLIKLLAAPQNNITAVGDDDQAIYKFRGASISNILQFRKDYDNAQEIFLNTNYRSCQNLLDASYNFIQQNNPNRLEVQEMAKGRTKKLLASNKGKGIFEHLHFPDVTNEVVGVVNKIIELHDGDSKTKKSTTTKKNTVSWSDFAILVRANDQAKPFIEGLERAGVPYQFVASRGLYAKSLVLDLIAFLRLLDNYHESDAMYRYLALPIFGLPQEEIVKITHLAYKKQWTLFETVRQYNGFIPLSVEARTALQQAVALLEKFIARAKGEKTSHLLFDFLNDSGYLKYIDSLEEGKKRREFSYLNQFYKKVKAFEEINDDQSVRNFLAELGLELESGEQGTLESTLEDEGPEAVKIMTVHGAKGLEFTYVFVVNLVDQRFPTRERSEPIQMPEKLIKEIVPEGDIHLQEERRLFYVALTRAKIGLFLTTADNYGGSRQKKPSIFLTSLNLKPVTAKDKALEKAGYYLEALDQKTASLPTTLPADLLPAKFSFTQIKDFQTCPRLYYYRYILKIPLKGNHYFSFGSSIHLSLQKFYEEAKKRGMSMQANLFTATTVQKPIRELVSKEELLKIYEANFIDDWYPSREEKEKYFKKGKELLRDFYQSDFLESSTPSYLEKGFGVNIGGYNLTGKIDRIDQVAGGYKIIDYKTGKPKAKLEAEDKEQLLIYQMAATAILNQKVVDLAYYYLDNDTQVNFLGTEKEQAALIAKISKTIAELKGFDFYKFIAEHGHCDYCRQII